MSNQKCTRCGSYAINEHMHGRVKGQDSDLCDVCYWRKRAELAEVRARGLPPLLTCSGCKVERELPVR